MEAQCYVCFGGQHKRMQTSSFPMDVARALAPGESYDVNCKLLPEHIEIAQQQCWPLK